MPYIAGVIILVILIVWFVFSSRAHQRAEEELRLKREEEERIRAEREAAYRRLEHDVLKELGINNWGAVANHDEKIVVKSRATLDKYDWMQYFKDNRDKFEYVVKKLHEKTEIAKRTKQFMYSNGYKNNAQYDKIEYQMSLLLRRAVAYRIQVAYITQAGNCLGQKDIEITQHVIDQIKTDPSLILGKTEYNKLVKEQQKAEKDRQKEQEKEALAAKHKQYYDHINMIVDFTNKYKDSVIVKGGQEQLDSLIGQLFDRTVNSIKKIKTTDSEEWELLRTYITQVQKAIEDIIRHNMKILKYYESEHFLKIKTTCDTLMSSQREFNEYINEKVQSISQLFGSRIARNETVNEDEYNYIRPYKKTITPFTAEVSKSVFESAENNPLEYVVKHFYSNKQMLPEQIQKLRLLVQELETLREAKQIIDNYKTMYKQYLVTVPEYIMKEDEAGFYKRLGFAHIDENVLTVEYKFAYTSGGGFAHRYFTVPMTEETIIELIQTLESKLTQSAFAKQQRALMTKKLRDSIKMRDNFTCCACGNSTHKEPNLLLEIDHIVPVAKGGPTEESNLQTLCWKCNRSKGAKLT